MSMVLGRSAHRMAIVQALLALGNVEIRQQAPHPFVIDAPRYRLAHVATGGSRPSSNGGKARKAAIRAARLRKYGTRRFGRYR